MPEINIKDHKTNLRSNFIAKVYALLCIQLAITFISIVFFNYKFNVRKFLHTTLGWTIFYTSLVISIALICSISCSNIAKKFPTNYIVLFSFTIFESILLTLACSKFPVKYILMAGALTTAITLALTIYAWTTKTDFTTLGASLFVALMGLCFVGLLGYFINLPFLHLVYNYLGVVLFSIYLIYDTQLIVGKHSHSLSEDDYVVAVIVLYLDILNLFLHILEILGSD